MLKKKGKTQMNKKQVIMAVVTTTALFGGTVTDVVPFISNGPAVVQAATKKARIASKAPATEGLLIHKLMYEDDTARPSISQDGSALDMSKLPDGVSAYDTAKYGHVSFTVADITAYINKQSGSMKSRIEAAQAMLAKMTTAEQVAWLKANGTNSKEVQVNDTGVARFSDLAAQDADGTRHIYASIESKHPKDMVSTSALPTVVELPMTNTAGDGYFDEINMYPKNNTRSLSFTLNKKGFTTEGRTINLDGAKFQLYQGKPGHGTKLGSEVTVKDGKITISKLTNGDYYFVEVPSTDVGYGYNNGDKNAKYVIGEGAQNNEDNKLSFTINGDTVDTSSLNVTYINYAKPNTEKDVTNGVGTDHSFEVGQESHHDAKIYVPGDIAGTTGNGFSGSDKGTSKTGTLPWPVFYGEDTPHKGLTYDPKKADLKVTYTKDDGTKVTLKAGTDYILTNTNGDNQFVGTDDAKPAFKVNFITTKDAKGNPSVSSTVAAAAGKTLHVEYDMTINSQAVLDSDIKNDFTLSYTNDPNQVGHPSQITDDATVHTYGAKFKKVDKDDTSKVLQDAEFVISNSEGKYYAGTKDTDGDGTKDVQWTTDKKAALVLKSNAEGLLEIDGLTEGTYQIEETKAPKDYQLLDKPVEFKVAKGTYTDVQKLVTIADEQKSKMPLTGGQIEAIVAGGLALVAIGGIVVYSVNKNKKNQQA